MKFHDPTRKFPLPAMWVPLAALILAGSSIPVRASDELSYSGASVISLSILYEGALSAFEKKTGLSFGRIDSASGTGRGLELLAEGKVTIAGSARALTAEETARGLVAYEVGRDAIAFWVNRDNPVKGLTRSQLRRVYRGEVRDWRELGGEARPIMVFIEPPDSRKSTLTLVQEIVMGNTPYPSSHSVVQYPREGMIATVSNEGGLVAGSLG